MYARSGLGCACRKPRLGAYNAKGLVATGASVGAGAIATAAGAGAIAGPIGAAAGLVAGLLLSANHPYGTCAPNAPDMASFLKCWGHAIPADLMPVWTDMWGGSDGKGWVTCFGAVNGQPPAGGCRDNPTGNSCAGGSYTVLAVNPLTGQKNANPGRVVNCAPIGTLQSMKGGGYDILPPAGGSASGIDQSLAQASQSLGLPATEGGIPTLLLLALAAFAAYELL